MTWNPELRARFDALRLAELAGSLTASEEVEFATLIRTLEAEEAQRLGPAMDRMHREENELQDQLNALQAENDELAKLLSQQQQFVADARRWLSQFDQRHLAIRQAYSRLTGQTLTAK